MGVRFYYEYGSFSSTLKEKCTICIFDHYFSSVFNGFYFHGNSQDRLLRTDGYKCTRCTHFNNDPAAQFVLKNDLFHNHHEMNSPILESSYTNNFEIVKPTPLKLAKKFSCMFIGHHTIYDWKENSRERKKKLLVFSIVNISKLVVIVSLW